MDACQECVSKIWRESSYDGTGNDAIGGAGACECMRIEGPLMTVRVPLTIDEAECLNHFMGSFVTSCWNVLYGC